MKLKLELIQDDGTVIESKIIDNVQNSKMNITLEPKIDIKMIVHNFNVVPTSEVQSGVDALDKDDQQFIDYLCAKYDHVCRGGTNSKHWSCMNSTENDVIVYQVGIKGPADWFYKKNNVWHHGGYTAYKETYTNYGFEEMIIEVAKYNESQKT